jgi:DNA-binding transcriptional MerR regulator
MAGAKTYSMHELQGIAGVRARTVRHWVRKRVLPKPIGKGRGARYTEAHVLRTKVTRQLRAQGTSLPAIRARLESLTEDQLRALLPPAPSGPPSADGVPAPPPPPAYPAESWDVVALMDGLVLLVNPKRGAALRRIAADIYKYYGGAAARTV